VKPTRREGDKSSNSRDKAGERHWGILKRHPLAARGADMRFLQKKRTKLYKEEATRDLKCLFFGPGQKHYLKVLTSEK
jgi:hypothetical protein